MKNHHRIYYICLLIILFSACRPTTKDIQGNGWEVIGDVTFEKGFGVSLLDPNDVVKGGGFKATNADTLFFTTRNESPIWQLSQWYSKYDIAHADGMLTEEHGFTYANEGKRITKYEDGSLLLEIKTSEEYTNPRKDGENWPHLLIEQSFSQCPNIGKFQALNFTMSLRLVKCENRMNPGEFDENFHTAQSPYYFILRNVNEQSDDFNKSIWLGIPSFDYRYDRMNEQELISWDLGTSMYIYNLPQMPVWGDIQFQDMQWHEAQVDILPLIKEAVTGMKKKDFFQHTSLDDLELVGMNFGWEVPGTFDAAIQIKGLSLKAL